MATFLAKFFKIGLEERQERRSKWLNHRANLLEVRICIFLFIFIYFSVSLPDFFSCLIIFQMIWFCVLCCWILLFSFSSCSVQAILFTLPSSSLSFPLHSLIPVSPTSLDSPRYSQAQKKEETHKQHLVEEKQILRLKGYTESDFLSSIVKLTEGALRLVEIKYLFCLQEKCCWAVKKNVAGW